MAEAILHSYTSCIDVLINEWNVNNGLEDKLHDTKLKDIGAFLWIDWDLAKLPKLLESFLDCVKKIQIM